MAVTFNIWTSGKNSGIKQIYTRPAPPNVWGDKNRTWSQQEHTLTSADFTDNRVLAKRSPAFPVTTQRDTVQHFGSEILCIKFWTLPQLLHQHEYKYHRRALKHTRKFLSERKHAGVSKSSRSSGDDLAVHSGRAVFTSLCFLKSALGWDGKEKGWTSGAPLASAASPLFLLLSWAWWQERWNSKTGLEAETWVQLFLVLK